MRKIPVILDTDIGDDIDDIWALAMLLNSPELDLKLVLTDFGDTVYRSRIVGKLLERANRSDVAIGIGIRQKGNGGNQAAWIEGYSLKEYPGAVHHNGVDALITMIIKAEEPMTLICIGPTPNIAAALKQAPDIAARTHFVGMYGSIHKGYGGKPGPVAEYNVNRDPASCAKALGAPWKSASIAPLDTCGLIQLTGKHYQRVRQSKIPVMQAVMESYDEWCKHSKEFDPKQTSSILFDTLPVYMAFTRDRLKMREIGIRVTPDGHTVTDPNAPRMDVAIDWKDLPGYMNFLTNRLLGTRDSPCLCKP